MIALICATSQNGIIGMNNQIPWYLPADLKRFRRLTMGHHLIMGRKTYESIGKPLPGRTTVVVTRQMDYQAAGCCVAHSLEAALALSASDDKIFITGGTAIYQAALTFATHIYLTLIHHHFSGDTALFHFDRAVWQETARQDCQPDEKNPYFYSYLMFKKMEKSLTHPHYS